LQDKRKTKETRRGNQEKNRTTEERSRGSRKKIQEEANTILLEAQLSAMEDRDRELKEREIRYQEELKKLKLAGITDLTLFEQEYREDVLAINKTYDDAELQREKDQQAKIQAEKDKQAALDKQRLADIEALESQARVDKIDRLISEFEFDNSIKAQSFQAELDLFDQVTSIRKTRVSC
jgi:hypothetical protein